MTTAPPALLLTAGLGTRLEPLTHVRAKPAVPVAGEPLARRIVSWLVAQGISHITCNLHHLPQTVTAVLGDGLDLGATIRYSWEQPEVLGSAGGPRQALDIVGADSFLIVNGDTLTDLPIEPLWRAHLDSGALVTLALMPNQEPLKYGGVVLADDGRVTGFVRKGPAATGSFHFIGVQAVNRQVFATLPAGRPASTIGGVYDRLLTDAPGSIRGLVVKAIFWDIGTVADYRRTSAVLAHGVRSLGRHSTCAPSAELRDTIVWDHVSIGEHAVLDECIVTDGVRVPDGAAFSEAILLRGPYGQLITVPLPSHHE